MNMELQDVHSFNLYSDGTRAKQSELSFSAGPRLHDGSLHGRGKMAFSIWQEAKNNVFYLINLFHTWPQNTEYDNMKVEL